MFFKHLRTSNWAEYKRRRYLQWGILAVFPLCWFVGENTGIFKILSIEPIILLFIWLPVWECARQYMLMFDCPECRKPFFDFQGRNWWCIYCGMKKWQNGSYISTRENIKSKHTKMIVIGIALLAGASFLVVAVIKFTIAFSSIPGEMDPLWGLKNPTRARF
ncbi:MAG: hypothetical protein KTR14_02960 [Vampirovibrio sp.]|nr:hypothetical protein [Vampirovibrio sp.]